jgi:two-component system, OmpR family, KDP operon response regulator KdpE
MNKLIRKRLADKAVAPLHGGRPVSDRRRILLCDAESQGLHALGMVLNGAGFEVDATRTAAEALNRAAVRPPTAAIIELVLPDGDGVELCRRLREWSAMPVILLSATRDEHNQVRAFEAGADDYMAKPLRPRELVARLLAKLRRAEPGGDQRCLELCGLEIDLAARAVRRDGDEIHLTPIEFKLLGVLLGNRGRVLTHSELLQRVWGAAYMDARETLRGHMANLRRKIEPADGGRLIHTDHGVGYRLVDTPPDGPRPGRRRAARAAPPSPAAWPPSRRPGRSPVARSLTNTKSGDLTPISGVRSPSFVSGSPETRAAATGTRSLP